MNADPAAMTEAERFAEIAELLARGIQRYFANGCKAPTSSTNSQVPLDALAGREAACGSQVQSPKSQEPSK